MTAKEYLSQVKKLDLEIEYLKNCLEEIWTGLTSVTVDPSKEAVDGSGTSGNSVDNVLDKYDELSRKLIEKRTEAIILRGEIAMEIMALADPLHVKILYQRYIANVPLDELAKKMGYDYFYIAHLHGNALKEFSKKFPEKLNMTKNSK